MRLRSDRAFMALAVLAFVVTRVAAMQPYLGDLDSVNFALALREFDLAHYQPHFPGYPVYVALARPLYALGVPAPTALELPAVLLGAISTVGLFLACRPWLGALRARLCVLLWIVCPGLWLSAGQPTSDGLGVAWFTLAIALLVALWPGFAVAGPTRRFWVGAGVGTLLGLGLGVRVSYFPVVVGVLIFAIAAAFRMSTDDAGAAVASRWRLVVGLVSGTTAGVLLWAIPMVVVVGPAELMAVATHAGAGHFTTWGGAISASGSPGWSERLSLFGWSFWSHGLGAEMELHAGAVVLCVLAVALGSLLLVRGPRDPRRRATLRFLGALALPYLVWVVFGQNPEKPRHVLPLIVLTLPLLAASLPGLAAANRKVRAAATALPVALVLSMSWLGAGRITLAKQQSAPSFQLVQHIATYEPPEGLVFYGGEEVRLFAYYAPWVRAKRAADTGDIRADLEGGLSPHRILVSSKVAGMPGRVEHPQPEGLTFVRSFARDPMVSPHYSHIDLYALDVGTSALWSPPGSKQIQ